MLVIGHRGACGYEPENTLASFKKALDLGVDIIELDIYALKTGELVVIHDDMVDRTTNGNGYVVDFSMVTLRLLNAGKGEKIPLLSEVLDLINTKVPINIELKGFGTAMPVADLIQVYKSKMGWSDNNFLVSSFDHTELAKFVRLMPSIRAGALILGIPIDYAAFAERLNLYSVICSVEFITPEFVNDAHSRKLKVFVFTVNEESVIKRMQSFNVDGVFSDYPDKVRSYLV